MANMTAAQLTQLNAAIIANPTWAAFPNNGDGHFDLAVLMNKEAAPVFNFWKSSVPVDEVMSNGFDWTVVDGLLAGRARIWEWMAQVGVINPSKTNVRDGVQNAFAGGTPTMNAHRLSIYAHFYRPCTAFERIFATGSGVISDANGAGPGVAVVDGPVTPDNIQQARNT